jgi:Flp pilus assembly protein TadG
VAEMNIHHLQKVASVYRQKGLAVVESAIVLPLVVFIILIVGEMGNAILQYNTLTHSVRNAARYIAEEAEAGTGVIQLTTAKAAATENLLLFGNINSGSEVLPGLSTDDITVTLVDSNKVSVRVEYDYQPIFFPNVPTIMGISGTGGAFTMRNEVIIRVL